MPRPCAALAIALLLPSLTAQAKAPKAGADKAAQRLGPTKDDAFTKKDKAIVAIDKFLAAHKPNQKRDGWRQSMAEPKPVAFAVDRDYCWHLATSCGEITVRLFPAAAPMHCTSVVYLARAGFYDGLTFHRAIKGFMAQGGCPLGSGNGNAGYTMAGELDPSLKHDRKGLLSTANEDGKDKTDGSQFFVTFAPAPHLDGKHTIFGEVVSGMDAVEAMDALGGEGDSQQPKQKITIERAWITVHKREPADADKAKGADDRAGGK